jgi:hypothetical protein
MIKKTEYPGNEIGEKADFHKSNTPMMGNVLPMTTQQQTGMFAVAQLRNGEWGICLYNRNSAIAY